MKTPFLGAAYSLRSLPLSAQTLVNLYAEVNESQAGEVGALYGAPGLTVRTPLDGGGGRALRTSGDGSVLYAVAGANVYAIDGRWRASQVGTLTSSVGPVSTASNNTQTLFSHGGGWHYVEGDTFAEIPDGVANAIVAYQDGYGIFTEGTSGQFGLTALNDFTSISGLDIATAEALPDNLISVYTDQRELWLFGTETTEIWANTGAEDFPFERIPGGVLQVGCAAPRSVAYQDGSIFWISRDRTGVSTVLRSVGYQTARVSTYAVEFALAQYPTLEDAIGFGYQEEGHTFYVLTFPKADATWVYDPSAPESARWSRRAWRDFDGSLHRHRAGAYAFWNNQHVVIDWEDGTLYTLDLDEGTDAGDPIYRERAWPLVAPQEMHRMRCDEIELVQEAGTGAIAGLDTDPQIWLDMSWDGGQTFGNSRYQTGGAIGWREQRLRWRRLGFGRRPVARVATTSSRKVAWLAANVKGEMLAV